MSSPITIEPIKQMTSLDIFLDIALPYTIIALLLITMILILRLWRKQVWWCACSRWFPFSCQVKSRHNSQHVADQYTLDHILHGVIFYWVVHFIPRLTVHHKALLTFFTAFLWEVIENSPFVINKYRENTISYGYEGDSVTNSIFDTIFCMGGFVFAYFTPWYYSLIFGIIAEAILAFWIRDNMLINFIMLIYAVPAIKMWQDKLEKRYRPATDPQTQPANQNRDCSANQNGDSPYVVEGKNVSENDRKHVTVIVTDDDDENHDHNDHNVTSV